MIPNNRAYTLIELLVGVTILAILAALLFPVVGGAIDRANAAKSINNLRQIGQAVNLFLVDNNGYYPFWGGSNTEHPAWYYQLTENDYGLEPFDQAFYSPYSGRDGTGDWPDHNPDYGMNLAVINHRDTRTKHVAVRNPAGTALMVETKGTSSIYAGDFRFNPYWGSLMNEGPTADGTSLRHGTMVFRHPRPASEKDMSASSSHVLFCDGHVEAVQFSDPRLHDRDSRNSLFLPDFD